jgi:hypothetical protein
MIMAMPLIRTTPVKACSIPIFRPSL